MGMELQHGWNIHPGRCLVAATAAAALASFPVPDQPYHDGRHNQGQRQCYRDISQMGKYVCKHEIQHPFLIRLLRSAG